MKFTDMFKNIIKQDLDAGVVPALMGPPGIGKSSLIESLAEELGTKAFVLPCNQLADKADLTGARLVPTEDGKSYKQVFFPHHVIQDCIDYAEQNPRETPLLSLDEINRSTADVTSGALTLITLRRMGHIELPPNVRIIVAGNDKGNVTTLDLASISRFSIYHVEPDAATLIEILGDDLNPYVRKVLNTHPKLVYQESTPHIIAADGDDDDDDNTSTAQFEDLFDAGEEMRQLTTPRTIHNISRWLNLATREQLAEYLGTTTYVDERESNMLTDIIESHIGNTLFAVQLVAVIAEDLASGGGQNSGSKVIIAKPACYDTLKSATTITELGDEITKLTDKERSGALLYALKEPADNTRLLEQLATQVTQIESEHTRKLFELASNQEIDTSNLEAFLDLDTSLVNSIKPMLSAFI